MNTEVALPSWVQEGRRDSYRRHHGRSYDRLYYNADGLPAWRIDGIFVDIVRFVDDGKFWVVADSSNDALEDIGPFDTLEQALVTIRLATQ